VSIFWVRSLGRISSDYWARPSMGSPHRLTAAAFVTWRNLTLASKNYCRRNFLIATRSVTRARGLTMSWRNWRARN